MNITTRYTLTMEEFDEDQGEDAELIAFVERTATGEHIDDVVQAFLHFLWNAGFTYVKGVTVRTTNGEVATA